MIKKTTNFIHLTKSGKQNLVIDKAGKVVVFFYNLSAILDIKITAPYVNLLVFGLYIGRKTERYNISTIQHHISAESSSNLLIKGVFTDQSRFEYEGLIRIEKTGQKSHAYQKNQNLILSPETYVDSRPKLEILANDVFCTHGSTTGRLNREQIFYTTSRGLSEKSSERLLTVGFIQDLFDQISTHYPDFSFEPPYNLI